MSPEEAKWFGQALATYPAEQISPLLNLGSSTREYRTAVCPEIQRFIFGELEKRDVSVVHSDLKQGDGIDVAGDILDERVLNQIMARETKAALCNNMFEHVVDRGALLDALARIMPAGGLLFISVPHRYPFHPDPIDNGFRPGLDELRAFLSPAFTFEHGEVISFGNYLASLKKKKWLVLRDAYLVVAGIAKPERWRVLAGNYRFLFRQFRVSCAVFRRGG